MQFFQIKLLYGKMNADRRSVSKALAGHNRLGNEFQNKRKEGGAYKFVAFSHLGS